MNMIEKVARATFTSWHHNMIRLGFKVLDKKRFEDLSESEMQFALASAKAAIEAMREPTEEMINAKDKNGDKVHYDYSCHVCGGLKDGYQAMIDAALKE